MISFSLQAIQKDLWDILGKSVTITLRSVFSTLKIKGFSYSGFCIKWYITPAIVLWNGFLIICEHFIHLSCNIEIKYSLHIKKKRYKYSTLLGPCFSVIVSHLSEVMGVQVEHVSAMKCYPYLDHTHKIGPHDRNKVG